MQQNTIQRGLQRVRADAGAPGDIKGTIEALQKAFADFRDEHTRQIDAVRQGNHDALQALKVENINAEITKLQAEVDRFNTAQAAAQINGSTGRPVDPEYSDSFMAHMRRGDVQAALNKGVAEEGGFLAPSEWDRTITSQLVLVSPMRSLAQVQPTGKGSFSRLYNVGGTASGWVGETDARPQTNSNQFKALSFVVQEMYANPAATQGILDDSEINLEVWLSTEVQTEFARQEGLAYVSGDGVKKPDGFLTYVTGGANAAKHPLGAIGLVNSGDAAAISADNLIDLTYALPSAFTGNASFTMNRNTQAIIRKFKNSQGDYLWQPSYVAGQPATLNGYPCVEMPDMPDVAANALPVAFGDFKRGYLIVDRVGVRVLRDPYTAKPYVLFYTTKRVGGGVQDPQCLKALKVAV